MKPILTAREVRALQGELARAILKAQRSADPHYRNLHFIQQAWGSFEDSLAPALP